uniref:DUF4283 domain-containing protein n=1 Tax=Arundo donax TaxID=35708 RepID=A0A0A9FXB4_ARUDO
MGLFRIKGVVRNLGEACALPEVRTLVVLRIMVVVRILVEVRILGVGRFNFVSASYWDDGIEAVGRLKTVWVKIRGLPLHLVRWYILAQVISSVIGKIKDIDLKASKNSRFTFTRAFISCLAPASITPVVRVEVDDWIYEFSFEIEFGNGAPDRGDNDDKRPKDKYNGEDAEEKDSGHFKRLKKYGSDGKHASGQQYGSALGVGNSGDNSGCGKQNQGRSVGLAVHYSLNSM